MRARYIYEELRFERTGDVKKGLGLDKRERIRRWFREWVPVRYEIRDDLSVHVGGSLYLRSSQVTQLPKDLSVGGKIYISEDQNIKVPDNLKHNRNDKV